MWNAYHLMSNRARAVCYAARNTQFRALTELTVNKLMQSAHSQIDALRSLRVIYNMISIFQIDLLIYLFVFNENFIYCMIHTGKSRSSAGTDNKSSVIVIQRKRSTLGTTTIFERCSSDSS